jgi:hypothetical protein
MKEFDRPPLPAHVRLIAALEAQNLSPLSLVDSATPALTPFLRNELLRFTHLPASTSDPDLIAAARGHLLSQPLYYIWQKPAP